MARKICTGFQHHDNGNYDEAVEDFTFVDTYQFPHLTEEEARACATAYVDALFAKDDIEDEYTDENGDYKLYELRTADWSPVRDAFLRRAKIAGMDEAYAFYSTLAWRKHKVGGDYWSPMMNAQKIEFQCATGNQKYPEKPSDGEQGMGPDPARYLVGVELHDMHTEEDWKQAAVVMTPYFQNILDS